MLVMSKDVTWYDERFRGPFGARTAQALDMSQHLTFEVNPLDFAVHIPFAEPEHVRESADAVYDRVSACSGSPGSQLEDPHRSACVWTSLHTAMQFTLHTPEGSCMQTSGWGLRIRDRDSRYGRVRGTRAITQVDLAGVPSTVLERPSVLADESKWCAGGGAVCGGAQGRSSLQLHTHCPGVLQV